MKEKQRQKWRGLTSKDSAKAPTSETLKQGTKEPQ